MQETKRERDGGEGQARWGWVRDIKDLRIEKGRAGIMK